MRTQRQLHQNFINYMNLIVNHPNYKSLPNKFKPDGGIKWVSPSDKARAKWWDDLVKKFKVTQRSDVARLIHPKKLKGMKPCQICGNPMSIYYIYPIRRILKGLLVIAPDAGITTYDDISVIFDKLKNKMGSGVFEILTDAFKLPIDLKKNKNSYINYIYKNKESFLSPGVMSNAPDRLDGFHTYNICCRAEQDTGRHRNNLARYTQDRRVYENWADGNWKISNRVMGEFNKYPKKSKCLNCHKIRKLTADHIGPISLGFTHRPKFNPLCRECNSQKNNRLTLQDVKTLIADEKSKNVVISWHSKYLWDLLKNQVKTKDDALKLTKAMRLNLHHVLSLFSIISGAGYNNFLKQFLHPEYSYVDYIFKNFSPLSKTLKYTEYKSINANTKKNANRYIRISFETLEEYKKIENRNTKKWNSKAVDELMNQLLEAITKKQASSISLLNSTLKLLAQEAAAKF